MQSVNSKNASNLQKLIFGQGLNPDQKLSGKYFVYMPSFTTKKKSVKTRCAVFIDILRRIFSG